MIQHPMTTLEASKESENSTSEITLEDTTPEKEEELYPARPKAQREYKSFGATSTDFLKDKIALMELKRAKY